MENDPDRKRKAPNVSEQAPRIIQHFKLNPLLPSERLCYEPLSYHNYERLHDMFENDPSEFINPLFKTEAGVLQYFSYMINYIMTSPSRGGCDWFFKTRSGRYAGVLHLYDLSMEKGGDRHRRCTIGFVIAAPFRRKKLCTEAVQHLLKYLFQQAQMHRVISYTRQDNHATQAFLKSLHFQLSTSAEMPHDQYEYFEIRQKDFLKLL